MAGGHYFAASSGLRAAKSLQVLAGVRGGLDRAAGLGTLAAGHERADVDDPLALLARDAGPVVRVCGVWQVLVFAKLVDAGVEQVLEAHALLPVAEEVLDRHLLGPVDDVL